MDRKWRCERNARGPRGPPGLFPAVCPCEAVCAGFPTRVASPRPSRPRNRPVAACEPGVRQEPGERRTAGTRGRRGKKTVQQKADALVSGDSFFTFISSLRQPIECFFNWYNRLTSIQTAPMVRSLPGLLSHVFGRVAAALISLICNP